MFTVYLDGLEFYSYHGVSDSEQTIGHRYVAHVEVDVDGSATTSDRVEDTVDYGDLAALLVETAGEAQYRTVERLAQRLAEAVLKRFPAAGEARVRLGKRLPPTNVIAEEAGVEIVLSRKGRTR